MGEGQSPSLQSRTEWPEAAEDSTRKVSQGSVELKMPEMNEVSLPGQAGLCWSQGCGGLQRGVSFFFFKKIEACLHTLDVSQCKCVPVHVEARSHPWGMGLKHHPPCCFVIGPLIGSEFINHQVTPKDLADCLAFPNTGISKWAPLTLGFLF